MSGRSLDASDESTSAAGLAKRYLARGWSVLPLRPRDKRLLILWEHLSSERPSEADVDAWFRRWPDANIGIVTGEISNLVVLDVDPKHGGDAAIDRLEHRFKPLPATVETITGGQGASAHSAAAIARSLESLQQSSTTGLVVGAAGARFTLRPATPSRLDRPPPSREQAVASSGRAWSFEVEACPYAEKW